MISYLRPKNNYFKEILHFNADPSDPSNPSVHHASDPSWKVLPERVKFTALTPACYCRGNSINSLYLPSVPSARKQRFGVFTFWAGYRQPAQKVNTPNLCFRADGTDGIPRPPSSRLKCGWTQGRRKLKCKWEEVPWEEEGLCGLSQRSWIIINFSSYSWLFISFSGRV